ALIMLEEFAAAQLHGKQALALSLESGVRNTIVAALGNLGSLHFHLADFDRATSYLQQAVSLVGSSTEYVVAVQNTIGQIYLAEGRLDEAARAVQEIERLCPTDEARRRYVFRHARVTRTKLLLQKHDYKKATASATELATL